MRDYARLDRFLDSIGGGACAEAPSEPHFSIARITIANLLGAGVLTPRPGCPSEKRQLIFLSLLQATGLSRVRE